VDSFPFWILFVGIGLVVAVVSVFVAKRQVDAMNAAWRSAAERLAFEFEPGSWRQGPTMTGTVDGFPAEIRSYTRSSGNSSSRYTCYTVQFPPVGVGLRLGNSRSGLSNVVHVDLSWALSAVPDESRFQVTIETRRGF
jgi:hypothetical protein